jgi:alpha-glucosidase
VEGPQHRGGIGAEDPQPDAEVGLRRARAATTLMLALPGSAYVYQGEELGLPEATRLPDEVRQDPAYEKSGRTHKGRDGCRVPMPWEGDAPSYGFGPGEASWLPQPAAYGELAVDRQAGVPGSTLELYRQLLRTRREHALGSGELRWCDLGEHVVAFDRQSAAGGTVRVVANVGGADVALPADAEVLVSSAALESEEKLPADTTVWLWLP